MTKSLDKNNHPENTAITVLHQISDAEWQTWRSETLRYLGYKAGTHTVELDDTTQQTLQQVFNELQELQIPVPVWSIFDMTVSEQPGHLYFKNRTEVIESEALWRHLKDYPTVAVLAATLGRAFDTQLKRLLLEKPADAVVYDAAGSALIEIVANRTERYLLDEAGSLAADATFRFSPGYGDLHMKYNKMLLELLRADKNCGITTTPGFAMTPKKSVVAILGFKPMTSEAQKPEIAKVTQAAMGCRPGRSCDLCLMNNDCSYKR